MNGLEAVVKETIVIGVAVRTGIVDDDRIGVIESVSAKRLVVDNLISSWTGTEGKHFFFTNYDAKRQNKEGENQPTDRVIRERERKSFRIFLY